MGFGGYANRIILVVLNLHSIWARSVVTRTASEASSTFPIGFRV